MSARTLAAFLNLLKRFLLAPSPAAPTLLACCALATCLGCGGSGGSSSGMSGLVVNSLQDIAQPPAGTVTLRSALASVPAGGTITFDPALDGGTIQLSLVASEHTILLGEVYSTTNMTFQGYMERDYGKSALYAKKNVIIDASSLPDGIKVAWTGGDTSHARVLAVYGDLTMKNVAITSGYANAEALDDANQPWTLARGGGLAVWGTATLDHCAISGNTASGDLIGSRDRGTYGGGIYANAVVMSDCIVSGNLATGYGAAGGGIYSVGGIYPLGGGNGTGIDASLTRCAVTGNRVTAQHTYGGGIFTLGGGPDKSSTMTLTNCTLARNFAEEHILLAGPHYCRGGGVYLGGGSLALRSCTIAENQATGTLVIPSVKPNLGGGGVAATIGDAHVVESMKVRHSILVGNTLNGAADDLFTGSLLHFYSEGYNRIGKLDFSQILVPVPPPDPEWMDLSRKHWPKAGDEDGLALGAVLDAGAVHRHDTILSAGTDAGEKAVLWYPPIDRALDKIPLTTYRVSSVLGGYTLNSGTDGDFLNNVVVKLRADAKLGSGFWPNFTSQTLVKWYNTPKKWPSDPLNEGWINFWRNLDAQLGTTLGTVALGDDFWGTFQNGIFGNVTMTIMKEHKDVTLTASDQRGTLRPSGTKGDIGAIELVD